MSSLGSNDSRSYIWKAFISTSKKGDDATSSKLDRRLRRHQKRLSLLKRRQRRRRGRLFSRGPSIIIAFSLALFLFVTFTIVLGEYWLLPWEQNEWCNIDKSLYPTNYGNPNYDYDPCRYHRTPYLLFMTQWECEFLRRLLSSVVFGGIIGYERRSADRPAGIRTMGLVSLGSCSFTISSIAAFKSSTMSWDASRVTAAIPSGVGFLGAGLIWKGKIGTGESEVHQVHGLTTAASLWLSAAVGAGSGGGLYFVTAYAVTLVIAVLRFGPKFMSEDDDMDDGFSDSDSGNEMQSGEQSADELAKSYGSIKLIADHGQTKHIKYSSDTISPKTSNRIMSLNDLVGMEQVETEKGLTWNEKQQNAKSTSKSSNALFHS